MSRKCVICGKKTITGNTIARRGLPKKKGGIGLKTTGVTKRKFHPNLQKKRIILQGKVQKVLICAKCIKAGKFTTPVKKIAQPV